jgi:CBS domain-containing protein
MTMVEVAVGSRPNRSTARRPAGRLSIDVEAGIMAATRTQRTAPTVEHGAVSPVPERHRPERAVTASDPVARLIHRAPVTVFLDTTLRGCARVMTEESIGIVLVDGPHGPVGVLSERDVVAAVSDGAGVDFHRARDYMTPDVDTVPETATIGATAKEMLRNEIRHVAVSRGDRTVGIVSIRDILAVLSED